MSMANMLLTVVLAIATVVQAGVLWVERRTPLENALYEKQISATLQAAEAVSEKCRLRFTPEKNGKQLQQDWVNMMIKRREAQFALYLVANKDLLALLSDVYQKEDVFDGEEYWKNENVAIKESFGKSLGKETLMFWKCSEISDSFLQDARKLSGLDVLSEDMRGKFATLHPSDLQGEPVFPTGP
jgi:hypothetical protein